MSSVTTSASAVNPVPPRAFDDVKVRSAYARTKFNRDLFELLMLAEQLETKITEFIENHDGATITDELLKMRAIKMCDTRNEFFEEDLLVPAEGVIQDAGGFLWSLNHFTGSLSSECTYRPETSTAAEGN